MELSKIMKRRIIEHFKEGKRFDGRVPLDYRKLNIETGISQNAEGSAKVKLGNTEVVAGVKMDVSEPYTDHEDEGTLIISVELMPMSSPRFEPGPPSIEAIEIARIVDRGLRESKFIDFKKLCIKKREKVWGIFVDLYALNDDGSLIDACAIAALSALLTARMPKYDEKEERVEYGEFTSKKIPLNENVPVTMTFYKAGKSIILDPTREEEESSEARLSLALSRIKNKLSINALQKGGEDTFTEEEIFKIIDLAVENFGKIEKEIKIQLNLQ